MNQKDLPFSPQTELLRWGPIPGKFLYVSMFVRINYADFRRKYDENWSETLFLFKEGRMLWLNDVHDLANSGKKVFLRYMLPEESRQSIYKDWKQTVKTMILMEHEIEKISVKKISDTELVDLWNKFNDLYQKFWVDGTVSELANYGSIDLLKNKLSDFISDDAEINSALEILTAPNEFSFYQEEEIELSKTSDIVAHQQKFYWIKNSYAGTQIAPLEFFAGRKENLSPDLEKYLQNRFHEQEIKKDDVMVHNGLSPECGDIANAIAAGISWQDQRKKYIFMALHYLDIMIAEMARRTGKDQKDFDNLWFHEVPQFFAGDGNMNEVVTRRKQSFGFRFFRSCREIAKEESEQLWKIYNDVSDTDERELTGTIVSKGTAEIIKGIVRIVFDPNTNVDFSEGEILVAPMTSPDYIYLMRKASVIITDTGGLTSHAAIVSRELGIPCLVNTKSATKILKDGDTVEVDVKKGIMRILT